MNQQQIIEQVKKKAKNAEPEMINAVSILVVAYIAKRREKTQSEVFELIEKDEAVKASYARKVERVLVALTACGFDLE